MSRKSAWLDGDGDGDGDGMEMEIIVVLTPLPAGNDGGEGSYFSFFLIRLFFLLKGLCVRALCSPQTR
ncbi:hypothetical protein C0Q70_05336 [Pomacea canaliculata]|uniref:Uncharacterized protein n=1 Tax=Pomacea canaliculata TaxID=400727 RepID=A0A2T7PKZ6_POMCA|nr:hypothetical protein C0Q70_05336 [Pomacea canaliculata]